ncbi:MAG: hypothetical protein ACYCW6_00030 [Candidatus Xenobia bacterium]
MAVGSYNLFTQPIGAAVLNLIVSSASAGLGGLNLYQTGSLKRLPEPAEWDAVLPALLLLYIKNDINALNDDPHQGARIPGVQVVYHYDAVYLRRQVDGDACDDDLVNALDLIAAIPFANNLAIPALGRTDGLAIDWWEPTGADPRHPLGDLLDSPEYRISVGGVSFAVHTHSVPTTS